MVMLEVASSPWNVSNYLPINTVSHFRRLWIFNIIMNGRYIHIFHTTPAQQEEVWEQLTLFLLTKTQNCIYYQFLKPLRFSWWCGWGVSSSGIWCCVIGVICSQCFKGTHWLQVYGSSLVTTSSGSIRFQLQLSLYFPCACCMQTQKKTSYVL